MQLVTEDLDPQIVCIRLTGRLDTPGTDAVELRFTALATTDARAVIVDLSGVDFLASIGMRLFVASARAKAQRGGKLALFGANELVGEALVTAGLDALMPLVPDQAAALAAVRG